MYIKGKTAPSTGGANLSRKTLLLQAAGFLALAGCGGESAASFATPQRSAASKGRVISSDDGISFVTADGKTAFTITVGSDGSLSSSIGVPVSATALHAGGAVQSAGFTFNFGAKSASWSGRSAGSVSVAEGRYILGVPARGIDGAVVYMAPQPKAGTAQPRDCTEQVADYIAASVAYAAAIAACVAAVELLPIDLIAVAAASAALAVAKTNLDHCQGGGGGAQQAGG